MPRTQDISNTPAEDKDEFRTPPWLFAWRNRRFLFEIDAAATHENALCSLYYTKEENALAHRWDDMVPDEPLPRVWCNPPYSDVEPWLEKAAEEARRGILTDMLLPAMNGEVYWGKYVHGVAGEVTFINGRISFLRPDCSEARGNRVGSILVTWFPHSVGPTRYVSVDRDAIRRAFK